MTTTFSVLTTVYNPLADHLTECLRSVTATTAAVEHVVVDDASTDPSIQGLLDRVGANVRLIRRPENGGICAATADALAAATNDWLVFLDHDDVLADGALDELAAFIATHPHAAAVYTDHDMIRPDGARVEPVYKPDFSPERLRQTNYITHLLAVRRDVALDVGGTRQGFDGAQDHDLLLRIAARGLPIEHLPKVLYHWRQSPASVATDATAKPYAYDAGRRAVADHLASVGIAAEVGSGSYPGLYRIHRHANQTPLVSVVIHTASERRRVWGKTRTFAVEAIRSIATHSTHQHVEFIVIPEPATSRQAIEHLERVDHRVRIASHVSDAAGDYLLLLDETTELIEPDSIANMVALLGDPPNPADTAYGTVGAVGAKLLAADGTIQHAGYVVSGGAHPICLGWPGNHPGPQRVLAITRECSAISGAAMMTTRAVFDEVDGATIGTDQSIDVSRAIRASGRRVLYTPFASWYHFATDEAIAVSSDTPHDDPYYNPNLTPGRADWLELPGRSGAPPRYS